MHRYVVTVAGQKKVVEVEEREGVVRALIDGRERVLEVRGGGGRYSWLEGERVVAAEVEVVGGKLAVSVGTETLTVEVAEARLDGEGGQGQGRTAPTGPMSMRAPMPGRVVKLLVKAGDQVTRGQGVLVVEAMKMENELKAPRDGRIKEIRVSEGTPVEAGEDLALIE